MKNCYHGCPYIPCEGCKTQEALKLKGGGLKKFVVLKIENISQYLSTTEQLQLGLMGQKIEQGRILDFKSTNNEYLVINTDEPYAPEIIEILKKNGHWGEQEVEE